jgi:molybdopterin biosynthesis enzyme MoaB
MVKINGTWINQDDVPPEEFRELLEKKLEETMNNIGFDRINTA